MAAPYAEVIGDPIAHSKSPLIHKFWLGKLGIHGNYRATRVTPAELPEYLALRRGDSDWRGCNVTMPLKENIVQHLDERDNHVARAMAANTLVRQSEENLAGHNTDVSGFREVFDEAVANQGAPPHYVATLIDLVGAGGAARAVATALQGHEVTIYNRTKEKAGRLADELGWGQFFGFSGGLEDLPQQPFQYDPQYPDLLPNLGEHQRYNCVVINASAMGMEGNPRVPIDLAWYPPNTIVIDLVYHPLETPLIRDARSLGMMTVDGLTILVAQAAKAFHLLFEAEVPREHDAELRELLTR